MKKRKRKKAQLQKKLKKKIFWRTYSGIHDPLKKIKIKIKK